MGVQLILVVETNKKCKSDCDDYDIQNDDKKFLEEVKVFCDKKGYELVWFCKDIEQVYLKRKVKDKDKKGGAARFKAKKLIMLVDTYKLQVEQYKPGCSNIIGVIDKYLDRK